MQLCDLTLPTPEENLACDEVLLDTCEAGESDEILRFWAADRHFVVVGYANKVATEVNREYCEMNDIPILRRCSGGGTVLQGPGCLNYSLVLRAGSSGPLASIRGTNEYVLARNQQALAAVLGKAVELQGHTDLAVGGLKFSGNAQRRRQRSLLFHGSFLLSADIKLMEKVLPLPFKQPEYRGNRSHLDFLINLEVPAEAIKAALARAWSAANPIGSVPVEQIRRLAQEKYRSSGWNFRF